MLVHEAIPYVLVGIGLFEMATILYKSNDMNKGRPADTITGVNEIQQYLLIIFFVIDHGVHVYNLTL